MEWLLSGGIAAFLSFCDMKRAFYVPKKARWDPERLLWAWGFVIANGVFAVGLHFLVLDMKLLEQASPWLRAIAVGLGYLALVRLKFFTFNLRGMEVSVGLEIAYDKIKALVYEQIDEVVRRAFADEVHELVNLHAPDELKHLAEQRIDLNQVLTPQQKRKDRDFINKVWKEKNTSDRRKCEILAQFILSGRQPDA